MERKEHETLITRLVARRGYEIGKQKGIDIVFSELDKALEKSYDGNEFIVKYHEIKERYYHERTKIPIYTEKTSKS